MIIGIGVLSPSCLVMLKTMAGAQVTEFISVSPALFVVGGRVCNKTNDFVCSAMKYFLKMVDQYHDSCSWKYFGALLKTIVFFLLDLTCISGSYTADGPYCPNVCGLASDRCTETGVEGCECPTGQWKEGNVCVDSSTCGCSDTNTGEYYSVS